MMVKTTKTRENRRLLPVIALALLAVMFLSSDVFAYSKLGGRCTYTRDCLEGYCLNSTCRYPIVLEKFNVAGNCSFTAECDEGFCKDGRCIEPIVSESSIFAPAMGIQSSCAGIIENCTGLWCMLCNVTWILLVVGAISAWFVSRTEGKLLPILLLVLPLALGFLIFPIAGFVLAVVEILLIAVIKRQDRKANPPPESPRMFSDQIKGL